ncbi:MAG: hypothetical protein M5R40_15560 [Anaerolineae bacterium]|nr:hypothetical protein [Anaerolineae bacterium]
MNRYTALILFALAALVLSAGVPPGAAQEGAWHEVARLGRGWMTDVAWSPYGEVFAVATFTGGVALHCRPGDHRAA